MADIGRQQRVFHYRQPLESAQFNRIFSKTLPPGIYEGGVFNRVTGTSISIDPLSVIIEDATVNSDIAVRIRTLDPVVISIAEDIDRPLIVVRYVWAEDSENYMEFIQVTESLGEAITERHEKDLILGKIVFDGTTIASTNSFDYTRADRAFANPQSDHLLPLLVVRTPVGTGNEKKVYVEGGKVLTDSGLVELVGQYSPIISDTSSFGRWDYLYLDNSGILRVQEGVESASPTTKPFYGRKVLAIIKRGAGRTDIKGDDIYSCRSAERGEIKSSTILVKDAGTSEVFAKNADGLITLDMAIRELWEKAVAIENRATSLEEDVVYKAGSQTVTGEKTFNILPKLSSSGGTPLTPTDPSHAVAKKFYDDNTIKLTTDQSVSGVKTFGSLPRVPITNPTLDSEVVSKKFYDDTGVKLTGDQTIADVKTFSSLPKVPVTDPTLDSEVVSKKFYDSTGVKLTGNQTIEGTKTFSASPSIPTTPAGASSAINKSYLDDTANSVVHKDGTETISGTKTFSVSPSVPLTPAGNGSAINKAYLDGSSSNVLHRTGDESLSGTKTFSNSPSVPTTPASSSSAVNKSFIDGSSSNLVHRSGTESIGGAKTFTSEVTAPSFNASSSRKVKENISEAEENALEIVKNTKIVRYSYIDDPDSYMHIGFIAEDTPEIMTGKDSNTMALSDVCGVLLKAVQELTAKIEKLESERI
jgi:hypothetical protein